MEIFSRRSKRLLFNPRAWVIRLHYWGATLLLGGIAVLLVLGSEFLDQQFIHLASNWPFAPFFIIPLGMTATVWMLRRYFNGAQGGGVPQVIASLRTYRRKSLLSARIFLGKTLAMLMTLASGASVGIAGPMTHIGASIMQTSSRMAHYSPLNMERTAIMAGGAAALATIFSAPLAGLVFAMEELSRTFQWRRSGTILITVLLASLVTELFIGRQQYFGSISYQNSYENIWLAVAVCGVAAGLLGGVFSQGILSTTRILAKVINHNPYIFAFCCGLIIAIIGVFSSSPIYGTSYHVALDIVQNPEGDHDIWFPFTKMLASFVAFLSGVPSGIFGPSIAIGAGLGFDLALWTSAAPAEIMVALGITGYFSGVFQTPITASVLILEITQNQSIILPIFATAFIAMATSRIVCPKPLYQSLSLSFLGLSTSSKP